MKTKRLLALAAVLLMLPMVSCGGDVEKPSNNSTPNSVDSNSVSNDSVSNNDTTSETTENNSVSDSTVQETNRNNNKAAWKLPADGFDETKEVEITFYSTMGKDLKPKFDAFLTDFNEIYPNIKVTHTAVGGYDEVLDQVTTELSTGTGPDITYCYGDHVALYNKTKGVVSLDNLIEDDEYGFSVDQYKDFIKGYYNEGKSFGDGLMYTLPFSKSTEILYYNKDVFDKEGLQVPDHWFSTNDSTDKTSMEYVCKTLKEKYPDTKPLGVDSSANLFITMTEQKQTPYTSATGEHFLFDTAENRAFLEKFKTWVDKDYMTTQSILSSYTSTQFVEQKSFMSIGSSAGATHQIPAMDAEGKYPFQVAMAEIPQDNPNNKKVISQGPSLCLLNHGDKQKVLASWLFMKYITTNTALQAEFSMASGYCPVIKSVSENETYKNFLKAESADQRTNAPAISAKLCLAQEANYFTSPAFIGSSIARTQVENMVTQYFTGTDIDTAFKDAIANCKAQL